MTILTNNNLKMYIIFENMDFPASHVSLLEGCFTILFLPPTWWPMIYLVTHVFSQKLSGGDCYLAF